MGDETSKDSSKKYVDFLEDLFQHCIMARHEINAEAWFNYLSGISSVLVTEMEEKEETKFNKLIEDVLPLINKGKIDSDMVVKIDFDLFKKLKEWEDSLRKIRKKAGLQQSIKKEFERVA